MTKPQFITFTGIDEKTDLFEAYDLAKRYPIEWGILYSPTQAGKKSRYPSTSLIMTAAKVLSTTSLHLCGKAARDQNNEQFIRQLYKKFNRVQINLRDNDYNVGHINKIGSIKTHVIIQTRDSKKFPHDKYNSSSVDLLYDPSGGKGIESSEYPSCIPSRLVGYAGGFSADNVKQFVDNPPSEKYWIDMESNIRTDDWLDLKKCERICELVYRKN